MHRTVKPSTWSDSWFSELESPLHRYVFLYLFTNEHTNPSGAYELSPRTMAFELGMPIGDVRSILDELAPKVRWWPRLNIVWVVNFYDHQSFRTEGRKVSPTFARGAQKELAQLPAEVVSEVIAVYPELDPARPIEVNTGKREPKTDYGDRASIGYRGGIDSEPITETGTETGTGTAQKQPAGNVVSFEGARKREIEEGFELFYAGYPKSEPAMRNDRLDAYQAWRELDTDPQLVKRILEDLPNRAERNEDWTKENGRYIPKASRYLRERMWEKPIRKDNRVYYGDGRLAL